MISSKTILIFLTLYIGLFTVGCSDPGSADDDTSSSSDDDTSSSADVDTSTDSDFEDPSSTDSVVSTPYAASVCSSNEIRCRGVCFSEAGQTMNGCTVVYTFAEDRTIIDDAVMDGKVAFLQVQVMNNTEIHRLNLDTQQLEVVVPGSFSSDDAVLRDGDLFFPDFYEPWASEEGDSIMRLRADGTMEPAAGLLYWYWGDYFDVFDGFLYVYQDSDYSIYRIPLGVGLEAPGLPSEMSEVELVAEGVSAARMASDGEYLYYIPDHAGAGLGRVKIGEPATAGLIDESFSYNFSSDLALPADDPDNIYFALLGLVRVPRVGGPPETVTEFPGLEFWIGDNDLLTYTSEELNTGTIYGVDLVSGDTAVVDESGNEPLTGAATADAYFIATERGVVRIER